jgi:hypothetical protein
MGAIENFANKLLFLCIKFRQSRSNAGLDGLRFQRVGALIYQENFSAARAAGHGNPHLNAPGGCVFAPSYALTLTLEEPESLKSQIATSKTVLRPPRAFTEHGVVMAAPS